MLTSTRHRLTAVGSTPSAPPLDRVRIEAEFRAAMDRAPGIMTLLLATGDGRPLTEQARGALDGRRVAAMANSFLTLGETLSRELQLARTEYTTVCTRQGNIVLFRIDAVQPMTLAAAAASDVNMGILLVAARDCANRIADIVSGTS